MSLTQAFERYCDRAAELLTAQRFIVVALPLVLAWHLLGSSPADPDLFARIAMGHLTLTSGSVPLVDPFAFTQTLPMWIDHEWLSGVVFYLFASTLQDAGLIVLKLLLATLSAFCIVHASFRYNSTLSCRFVWIAICLLHASAAWTSTIRCQAFTYLFIPLLYWAMIEYRDRKSPFLLRLSPLMAIPWVNMHGGYALGCVLVSLFVCTMILERRGSIELVAILAAWLCAPFFTPYGFSAFTGFLFNSLGMERPGIEEWLPLFADLQAFIVTIIVCVPLVLGMWMSRKKISLFPLGALVLSGYCAFRHQRFLSFFMITAALYGAPYVELFWGALKNRCPSLIRAAVRSGSAALTLLLIAAGFDLLAMTVQRQRYHLDFSDYPVGAVEWLRTTQQNGRLLVDFNLGSFSLWRLYPRFKISVDGRYEETYPPSTVRNVLVAMNPDYPDSRATLERLAPTHILLPNTHGITDPAARFGSPWRVIYQDPYGVVLGKDGSEPHIGNANYQGVPKDMWTPLF